VNLVNFLPVLLGLCALGYVLLGACIICGKRPVGNLPLALTFITIGIWVFGGVIEALATSYLLFSIGRVAHFIGTAIVPVSILICFREYTGRETSRTTIATLLILPLASILVAASNQLHELMWLLPAVNTAGEFLTRPAAWGPWFLYLHAPYGYAIIMISVLTLVLHSSAVAPVHRRGLFMLAGSAFAPAIAVAAYDLGIGPDTLSTLPLIFAAMLPIYAWLIIGERIIEFSPLAYETVFQNMQDPVVVVDEQRRIIGLNHCAERLLNVSENDAMRTSLDAYFGDEISDVNAALETGEPQRILTATGRFLHLQVTPIAANKASARTARVLMFRDVSDVEKLQQEKDGSERLLRTIVDHSVNGIVRLRWKDDQDGSKTLRCIFANGAACRFLNTDADQIIGHSAEELVNLACSGMSFADTDDILTRFLDAATKGSVLDTEARVEVGENEKWLRVIGEPVGEDVAMTLVEITDNKAKELQMESIAWSDPLTGVLNRRGFERDASLRLSYSDDDASGALLYIDLNDFKQINDRHGHSIGDQVLTIVADRLREVLRSGDFIGRPGGDEFVVLVPDVTTELAGELARRVADSLEQSYLIGTKTLYCAASIGLALYPEHASTLTGLLRAADQAMYRAKARNRDVTDIRKRELLERAG